MSDETSLDLRSGLPDALRVLLEEYPRQDWEADPGFDGLLRFWLDRHQMFRKLLEMLRTEAEGVLDRKIAPEDYAGRLSHYGSMFLSNLHGHHQIEDHHYFPVLAARDARVAHGFEILDKDHHDLDFHLNDFAEKANATLQGLKDPILFGSNAGALRDKLSDFDRFLNRHLTDEEELVVPVILKYGTEDLG